MSRSSRSWAFAFAVLLSLGICSITPAPVDATIPQAAIIWKVDDKAKTITVTVKLEVYSACDTCPGTVGPFKVGVIRDSILRVWNQHYHFRCYELIFDVDIKIGSDRFNIDDDRVGVRIDNSPVPVRSYVHGVGGATSPWNSDDPADKWVPTNDILKPTTWSSDLYDSRNTYAHEYGHVIGLDDAYHDVTDPTTGEKVSVPLPDAPLDIMSTQAPVVAQSTIDRLIRRSPVDIAKLKCGWTTNADTPLGKIRGVKCGAIEGEWTVSGHEILSVLDVTTLWNITINEATLAGTYKHEKIQTSKTTVTTANASGNASIVNGTDGSVLMTLDAAPIKLHTKTAYGGVTVMIPGAGRTFLWEVGTKDTCP
jgi:hypothetical protein